MTARPNVGEMLRDWRTRQRRSQMDLAIDVGVSSRHLSFVETGRSRPSPELVLALAEQLDVPLRERNTMLLAAGYAPRYTNRALSDVRMSRISSSLQRMLDSHNPYPGVVIDREWNVVLANVAAGALTAGVPAHVLAPQLNVFRISLHPEGLAARTVNFNDWAAYLLRQLRRSIVVTGDENLQTLEQEVLAYPNLVTLPKPSDISHWDEPPLLVPFVLDSGGTHLSFFTTLTTFGTPRDVTVDELCVELFFPADDETEAVLKGTSR